ncbi:Hsp70 family protein [Nocardia jejuensis]|uniref:Hsp70 family protein n=1 Tax=Nocardia jejuensis TaxID=328049 RepID=UPI000833A79E|nr:Hsp70 family protein [Nocardia jejuensis]
MGRVVGIDLGTSSSTLCVLQDGKPTVLSSAEGAHSTPSVVGFIRNGLVIAGQPALDRAVTNAPRTFRSIRRPLGSAWSSPAIDGRVYAAQDIAACVLMKLKRDGEAELGEEITDVIISVPALSSEAEQQATERACAKAGLHVLRMVSETSLAGFTYGLVITPEDRSILVVDLGAGTLSVGLFEIGKGITEVRTAGGDNRLGGDEWDHRIVDWLIGKLGNTGVRADIRADPHAMERLRAAAEKARIELSSIENTTVALPYIGVDAARNPVSLDEALSRVELQRMTSDLTDRCRAVIEQTLAQVQVSTAAIDHVVLVGGATRMPAIAAMVKDLIGGREPHRGLNPDEAVAVGAAALSGVLDGTIPDRRLVEPPPRDAEKDSEPDGFATAGPIDLFAIPVRAIAPAPPPERAASAPESAVPAPSEPSPGAAAESARPPATPGSAGSSRSARTTFAGAVRTRLSRSRRAEPPKTARTEAPTPARAEADEPAHVEPTKRSRLTKTAPPTLAGPKPAPTEHSVTANTRPRKPAGVAKPLLVKVLIWFFSATAAFFLVVNVPHLFRTVGGDEPPTCAGHIMSKADACRIEGKTPGYLGYEEMQQRQRGNNRDNAVSGTVIGALLGGAALLLIFPPRRRRSDIDRGGGSRAIGTRGM